MKNEDIPRRLPVWVEVMIEGPSLRLLIERAAAFCGTFRGDFRQSLPRQKWETSNLGPNSQLCDVSLMHAASHDTARPGGIGRILQKMQK